MRTFIITLAILVVSVIGNNLNAKEFYKNVEVDTNENTITTFIYEGENSMNFVPYAKHIVKLSNEKEAKEKTIYTWNSNKYMWTESQKYEYHYNLSGEMEYLSFTTWNKALNMWEDNVQYTIYIYNAENDLLTINNQ